MTLTTHADVVPMIVTAVEARLKATAGVTSLLASGAASVFVGEAPMKTDLAETPADYLVLTNPSGEDAPLFGVVSGTARVAIDIWALTQARATAIYAAVAAALQAKLVLTDARHLLGTIQLLAVPRDPGRRLLYHGIARYEARVAS